MNRCAPRRLNRQGRQRPKWWPRLVAAMLRPIGPCVGPLGNRPMRYLHTMVRVSNLEESLDFFCNKLGLVEVRRKSSEQVRFTLVFLAAPGDTQAQLELTWNWDPQNSWNSSE